MKSIEIKSFDKKITNPPIEKTILSKLRSEYPILANLYDDLNNCIDMKHKLSRSRDLARNYENEEASIRKRIKEFERSHNITREDHLRWNT